MDRSNLKAELDFLRDLFFDKLPMGEKKKNVEQLFSLLEEAIYNKDPDDIQREEFPPDDPAISGNRVYKYHSAAQFKKLASRHQQLTGQQDMDTTKDQQEVVSTEPNQHSKSEDVAYVQEHPETGHTEIKQRECN